jgi:hypothetical protein
MDVSTQSAESGEVLRLQVEAAASGTGWTVRRTRRGFAVRGSDPDLFNQGLLTGEADVYVYRARLDQPNKRYSLSRYSYKTAWISGLPKFSIPIAVRFGFAKKTSWDYTLGSDGVRGGKVFDSKDGRLLITTAASELGWSRRVSYSNALIIVGVLAVAAVALAALAFIRH